MPEKDPNPQAHIGSTNDLNPTRLRLKAAVEQWLCDVQRRGAELYAQNETVDVQYLAFEGRNHARYGVEVDYALGQITVEITREHTSHVPRETVGLTEHNLKALANRISLLKEGQACVPVSLLAQLAVVCHAYRRLIADFDQERHIQTSTNTVQDIEATLARLLTPEERRRTDNPLLRERLKRPPANA